MCAETINCTLILPGLTNDFKGLRYHNIYISNQQDFKFIADPLGTDGWYSTIGHLSCFTTWLFFKINTAYRVVTIEHTLLQWLTIA